MLQRLVLSSLDDVPTLEETQKNVKELQAGEAPVPDWIPPKIFKEGGDVTAVKLTELMLPFGTRANCLWTSRTPTSSTCSTRTKMTEHPVTTTEASRC